MYGDCLQWRAAMLPVAKDSCLAVLKKGMFFFHGEVSQCVDGVGLGLCVGLVGLNNVWFGQEIAPPAHLTNPPIHLPKQHKTHAQPGQGRPPAGVPDHARTRPQDARPRRLPPVRAFLRDCV